MGFMPKRSRPRRERLPLHEHKDRDSNDSYVDSDYDSDDEPSPTPSPHNARGASQASAPIMASRAFEASKTPTRAFLCRLPNKVTRYLCFGLAGFMILFIFSLVRASQNENLRVAEGVGLVKPKPPVWESYEFLQRYYGGIRNLSPRSQNIPEYPRDKDELPLDKLGFVNETDLPASEKRSIPASKEYIAHPQSIFKQSPETFQECFVDAANTVRVPPLRYYDGRPNGFPENILGSYELFDLPDDICFERYGRYGPYGLGYARTDGGLGNADHGETEGSQSTWSKVKPVDWSSMDWAAAQRRCYRANANRYKSLPSKTPPPQGFFVDDEPANVTFPTRRFAIEDPVDPAFEAIEKAKASSQSSSSDDELVTKPSAQSSSQTSGQSSGNKLGRTAVVIRVWDEYNWRDDDLMHLRSLITELSLASGGRYDVHLLVQVKNDAEHPIWADADAYQRRIEETIPEEFRGLATLWTETQMLALYQGIYDTFARGPGLPIHGVYRGLEMAMQYFAYQHPEYEYFWQWEMDIRYTGHYYDFFTKVENWARDQPRKGLWERNGRFYVPSVHGTWEDFKQMARVQTEMGVVGADNIWNNVPGSKNSESKSLGEKFVWGPERPKSQDDWFEIDDDPTPPHSFDKDKYEWGVGEEAEYIAFNPMYDPEGTTWGLRDDITGYNIDEGMPPRRAQIITASRMSRRLLMMMHRETAFKKKHAFPEMWPGTVALQHGYKGVFAPHPIFVDREWPTEVIAQTLNNGKNGAAGGSRTAVFGDREHNLRGLTWFYDTGFSGNLYKRWLGMTVNNDGGTSFELFQDPNKNATSVSDMRGGEGRMCLPPMLLHPIKEVDLPMGHDLEEEEPAPVESDPFA